MKYLLHTLFLMLIIVLFVSCASEPEENVVDVIARDFKFVVDDSIPSGWTTFQFTNEGHTEHFFLLNKLPDSITYDRYHTEVTKPFEAVFDSIKAGKTKEEAVGLLISMIPSWYFTDVKAMGGPGILSMQKSEMFTIKLEPGTYAMECYIKEQGVFHTALGMIRPITVTNEKSSSKPPMTNINITLTNDNIDVQGAVIKGRNSIAVQYKEHPTAGLGNDVHLIRVNDTTHIDSVFHWLDWMNVTGLQSPSPAVFLGGIQEMPVGYTSYFYVTLDSGDYAWVTESSPPRNLIKEFTVK